MVWILPLLNLKSNIRANGANFTLEDICGAARFLLERRLFTVQHLELGVPSEGNGNFYLSSEAQLR